MSVKECCLDVRDDVADVVVGDARAAGEAEAGLEELLADSIDIGRYVPIDRLPVHGLPQRAGLDAGGIQGHSHGLDIAVGLTVGMERSGSVGYSCGSAHSTLNGRFIGVFFALDMQIRI